MGLCWGHVAVYKDLHGVAVGDRAGFKFGPCVLELVIPGASDPWREMGLLQPPGGSGRMAGMGQPHPPGLCGQLKGMGFREARSGECCQLQGVGGEPWAQQVKCWPRCFQRVDFIFVCLLLYYILFRLYFF